MEARQATERDVRSLASALARAFHDDPVMTWLFGDRPGPRLRRLRRYFASEARRHGRHGQVLMSCDHAGAAFWDPPRALAGDVAAAPALDTGDAPGDGPPDPPGVQGARPHRARPSPRAPLVPAGARHRPAAPGQGCRQGGGQSGARALRPRGPGRVPRIVQAGERALLRALRLQRDRADRPAGGPPGVAHVARPEMSPTASAALDDAVSAFVADLVPEVEALATTVSRVDTSRLRSDVVVDAYNLACGFIDADGLHT